MTNCQQRSGQKEITKQIGKIWTEVVCFQILPMDLTMHLGQDLQKKDEVLMCTKQLENFQNLEKDDLVEMGSLSEWNEGIRYLLMVIDVFSKYGWIQSLKNKRGETVANAFSTIFSKGRKPKKLWIDKGREFWNKNVEEVMDKFGVERYSTQNEEKSSVVERWNRTIKGKIWKMFSARNEMIYVDKLKEILKDNNNTKHSSIGMTPVQASKKMNERKVYAKLYEDELWKKNKSPKFKVGDKVRISKWKKGFKKGFTPNWTEEIFVVKNVLYTKPTTYKLKDLLDDDVEGSFYEQELQKVRQEIFRIKEVLESDE